MAKWGLKALELSEAQLEIMVCNYLASKRIFFWKSVSTGYFDTAQKRFRRQHNPFALNGVPDLCIVYKSRFYGFEIKTAKGKQSENQMRFESRLRLEGGAPYFIIRSVQDAERALEEIISKA